MNYLGKFLPSTTEVCEPLRKLTSSQCEWTWNNTYQRLYNRAKTTIKKDATIVFYIMKEQLYLETNMSGVSIGASPLQTKILLACGSKELKHLTLLCCDQ